MTKLRCFRVIVVIIFLFLFVGCGSLDQITGMTPVPLDEQTIVAGLKEALEIGTRNAVSVISQMNGYYSSPAIRIPLPDELAEVGKKLRDLGLEKQVDEFIESMNHAAEEAAKGATGIFLEAIKEMTFTEARSILKGPDNAATRFFESHTRNRLYAVFFPVVKDAMDRGGAAQLYRFLITQYNRIPLVEKKEYDLDEYVVNRALDGLFFMLAGEESKIRSDPAARVTELLRKVFGS